MRQLLQMPLSGWGHSWHTALYGIDPVSQRPGRDLGATPAAKALQGALALKV